MYENDIIPVTRPYLPPVEKYQALVADIYRRGWLTNNGPLLQELEDRLATYLGIKNLICVANGTLALQIAYKALGLKGRVVTTPFSFIATASSLKWEGLEPVFADINPKTFNPSPECVEKAIDETVSAILPVHVFGNPCDVDQFEYLGKKYGIPVIYDASHAFGVKKNDGTSILNFGNISTLSFHSTKLFHTIEGGAIITDDDELADKIRLMINFGIDGPDSVSSLGINAKMNEFQAATGLLVLDAIDDLIHERKEIVSLYKEELAGLVDFQLESDSWVLNGAYMPILAREEIDTLKIQSSLKKKKILTRRYFSPSLDRLEFLSDSTFRCEESRSISSRILCMPIFNGLNLSYIKTISKEVGALR